MKRSNKPTSILRLRSLCLALLLATGGAMGITACDSSDGPAEETGEEIDEAAEKTKQQMDETTEEMREEMDDNN